MPTPRHPAPRSRAPRLYAFTLTAAALAAAALVTACGGGGSGGNGDDPAVTLQGTAAIGRAFTGATVTVIDSTGKTRDAEAAVGADGSFEVDLTGLTAPLAVVARGAFGDESRTLVSLVVDVLPAAGTVTSQVNPLTHALAAAVSGNSDPSAFTGSGAAAALAPLTAAQVNAKLDVLRAALAQPIAAAGLAAATYDPRSAAVTPGSGTGADYLVETIKVAVSDAGIELRDALSGGAVTITPATVPADVSGDKGLPAAPAGLPPLAEVLAEAALFEAAFDKCNAVPPEQRVDAAGDPLAPCQDVSDSIGDGYLHNSYSAEEVYLPMARDAALTGAKFRVEVDRLAKADDGTAVATLYLRWRRTDGGSGFRVEVARKAPGEEWFLTGNQRAFDAGVQPVLNRTLYTSPARPLDAQGNPVALDTGNSFFESGLRFGFNPLRHPDVRAVRITNAQAGVGGLPAAGIVLARAQTDTAVNYNGCGRADRLVLANNTGDVTGAPVTFRSNNVFVLDRAAVEAARPIGLSKWAGSATFADSPLGVAVPAYTRYRFEVFKDGNTSGTPDATFTGPILAPVRPAAAGAAVKWPGFDAATLAQIQPGAAVESPVVAWSLPAGGAAPTSVFAFARPSNSPVRTQAGAAVPFGASSTSVPNTVPVGCAAGPMFGELGTSGGGFRGVGTFHQDGDTTRHDNAVQWVNWQ